MTEKKELASIVDSPPSYIPEKLAVDIALPSYDALSFSGDNEDADVTDLHVGSTRNYWAYELCMCLTHDVQTCLLQCFCPCISEVKYRNSFSSTYCFHCLTRGVCLVPDCQEGGLESCGLRLGPHWSIDLCSQILRAFNVCRQFLLR